MVLVFACEHRFYKDISGRYYTNSQSFGDQLWQRYLVVFDKIKVFARVNVVSQLEENLFEITNPKVSFIDIPYYIGPVGFLKKRNKIIAIANQNAIRSRAYICRVPGQMGTILSSALRKQGIPYAVEVVGDPWDVFAPGAINHPLTLLFRILGYRSLKRIVLGAKAALYVTKNQLQKRYRTSPNTFSTFASNVILRDEDMVPPKEYSDFSSKGIKLLAVGSLEQMYKSPDVAIETVALLKNQGFDCSLRWLGDGKYRKQMEELAIGLGLSEEVCFIGNVSSERVREELASTAIFIHISRTEGLPRAVVEAMGAGLPCIGSRVGGIPELLDACALVEEITPNVVAEKIKEFVNNPNLMNTQAARNFEEAKNYLEPYLNQKRKEFYQEIVGLY